MDAKHFSSYHLVHLFPLANTFATQVYSVLYFGDRLAITGDIPCKNQLNTYLQFTFKQFWCSKISTKYSIKTLIRSIFCYRNSSLDKHSFMTNKLYFFKQEDAILYMTKCYFVGNNATHGGAISATVSACLFMLTHHSYFHAFCTNKTTFYNEANEAYAYHLILHIF